MKNLINQWSKLTLSKVTYASSLLLLLASMGGCVGDSGWDNGTIIPRTLDTPSGQLTSVYCPNVGINDETCVLSDPANPYRNISVNGGNKWDLNAEAEASMQETSHLRYYLWATALATEPSGENQFYTASALQANYYSQGSLVAQDQAKKAYRSFLDNFLESITFDENDNPISLINWVAPNLVSPGAEGFLYDTQQDAIDDLDSWGYEADLTQNPPLITKKTD